MSGLEEVGIPGPENLKEALTNCADPLSAIEDFQVQNGILLPSLRPALPFLDLHAVARLDFHQSVMEELREKLLHRINELAEEPGDKQKTLNDLLTKSFPVIKVASLRPVVMCILKHLPKIKQEYLDAILADKELYKEAAVEVKQQIWQDNQALFGDEVSPLLARYIEDKEKLLFNTEAQNDVFFSPLPKARRQEPVVQQLVKMIGKNIKLYDLVLQFLRTLFLRTRNTHYCTLRAEILMALHDLEIHEIFNLDPCHKFTWCLDACVRERYIDNKRAKELQGFLDGIRRGQEQVLGDICMILCDPFAIHTVASSIMKCLQHSVTGDTLPRQSEEAVLLLRMLSLGLGAWHMIDSQQFKETKLETTLVTKFLPCVISLLVNDQLHSVAVKLGEKPPPQEAIPDYVVNFSRTRVEPTTVFAYYTLLVCKHKDVSSIQRAFTVLRKLETEAAYQDTTLHLLIAALCQHPELFAHAELTQTVLMQFLMPNVSKENMYRHILRLLWWVHHRVPAATLTKIMTKLEPNTHLGDECHKAYASLKEKIANYQPTPPREPEKLEPALMNVPPPTPHIGLGAGVGFQPQMKL